MVTVRTNLCTNPHGASVTGWYWSGAGGAADLTAQAGTDTPDGRAGYVRATITSANASGNAGPYYREDGTLTGKVGDVVTVSMYVRYSADPPPIAFTVSLRAGGKRIQSVTATAVTPVAGEWVRLSATITAQADYDGFQAYASESAPSIPPVGSTVDATMVLVEYAGSVAKYFDGDTPAGKYTTYAWTGEPNASASTETYTGPPSITATVLTSSTEPPPIQLAINDVPAGATYDVQGVTSGGRTWNVAGGHGISEGVQVVLIDNRGPVNVPIRYRLVTSSGTADSNTVTRPWSPPGIGADKYLIQSLDGRTIIPIAAWIDNQLPKQPELHTAGFPIRGRRRPVMVLAVAGEGTMTVTWRLTRAASALLDQIIADGGGIVLITDGTARDLPVSDTAVITSASSALWEAEGGVSTQRVWELELTWIDDPEPSTIPVVWDVDGVDTLLAGKTVDEVDAQFAGMTVDEVDQIDWGALDVGGAS